MDAMRSGCAYAAGEGREKGGNARAAAAQRKPRRNLSHGHVPFVSEVTSLPSLRSRPFRLGGHVPRVYNGSVWGGVCVCVGVGLVRDVGEDVARLRAEARVVCQREELVQVLALEEAPLPGPPSRRPCPPPALRVPTLSHDRLILRPRLRASHPQAPLFP